MKHNLKVSLILVLLFIVAQLIGLYITTLSTQQEKLAFGLEKPELEQETGFIYIFLIIILVTIIALIMARFNAFRLWKVWFFISIVVVLTISLSFFLGQTIALILSLLAAYFKV